MFKRFTMLFLAVLLMFSLSMAQTDIGLKGVGGKLGYIMPDGDIENTLGFGLIADLGQYNDNISLSAYVDYWGKNYDVGQYYEWSWSMLSIAAIAKYGFETSGQFKPYAGGGLGLDIGSWDAEYKGPTNDFYGLGDFSSSGSDSDLAIHLVGGATMELSPGLEGMAEVKYTIGGADYFGIYVGVIYSLNR
jgi:hypothetical protein